MAETLLLHSRKRSIYSRRHLGELAKNEGIPILSVTDHNQPDSENFLKNAAPDLIVFTGGGLIRENILADPAPGCS